MQVEPSAASPSSQPTARLRDTIADRARAGARRRRLAPRRDGHDRAVRSLVRRRCHALSRSTWRPSSRMLEIAGRLSQGVLLTLAHAARPIARRRHVAIGTRARPAAGSRGGRTASLIPARGGGHAPLAARDLMRPAVGLYAGFFPRYNRLLARGGVRRGGARRSRRPTIAAAAGGAAKVGPRRACDRRGGASRARRDTCRERLAAYRPGGAARCPSSARACRGAGREEDGDDGRSGAAASVSHPARVAGIHPVRAAHGYFWHEAPTLLITKWVPGSVSDLPWISAPWRDPITAA